MIKVEYINPFYQATIEVLQMMLDLKATRILPGQSYNKPVKQVVVAIGITGDLVGTIQYRFPEKTILKMVSTMSGMEFDQVDDFATSAVAEISNIISGNATTRLTDDQFICDIMPPNILFLDATVSTTDRFRPDLTIPMHTPAGNLFIDIALKQSSTSIGTMAARK